MPRPLAVLLTLAVTTTILLLPASDASAAPTPAVSPSTVQRDGSVTVSGTGCWDPDYDPYGDVGRSGWTLVVRTTPWSSSSTHAFASVETDEWDGGAWSVTLRLPATVGPGSYAMYARCMLGTEEFDYPAAPFTVIGDPLPPNWWEPGGSGPPGQPKGPPAATAVPVAPSAPAPVRTPAPGATSAGSSAPAAAPTPVVTPTTAPTGAATPDCADCPVLAAGGPILAGRALRLAYSGFQPGEQVTVVLRSTPTTLGTFTADATGTVTATVTLPEDVEAGEHTLTFSGPGSGDLVVVPLRVTASASTAAATAEVTAAPRSDGSEVVLWVGAGGLALVVLGASALPLLRRRDRARATSGDDQATATPIAEPIA